MLCIISHQRALRLTDILTLVASCSDWKLTPPQVCVLREGSPPSLPGPGEGPPEAAADDSLVRMTVDVGRVDVILPQGAKHHYTVSRGGRHACRLASNTATRLGSVGEH